MPPPPSSNHLNGTGHPSVPESGRPEPAAPTAPAATPGGGTGWPLIGPIHSARTLREWTLVLRSMQISHTVHSHESGWFIITPEGDYERASAAIRLYEAENRDWPPSRAGERLPHPRTLIAPALFFSLILFFFVTGPASSGSAWFSRGTASSELILRGQPWRALTGLTLHADILHVVGNALSGSIFLSAVNRRMGDGRGPLLTLIAGTLGNLANAVYHRGGHLSIGASTAVFSAVGILVATQILADERAEKPSWSTRAAPIVGGLALLGMLGASPHSDMLAHLFGLLAGVLVGLGAGLLFRGGRGQGPLVQAICGVLTAAAVAGAWGLAWR